MGNWMMPRWRHAQEGTGGSSEHAGTSKGEDWNWEKSFNLPQVWTAPRDAGTSPSSLLAFPSSHTGEQVPAMPTGHDLPEPPRPPHPRPSWGQTSSSITSSPSCLQRTLYCPQRPRGWPPICPAAITTGSSPPWRLQLRSHALESGVGDRTCWGHAGQLFPPPRRLLP